MKKIFIAISFFIALLFLVAPVSAQGWEQIYTNHLLTENSETKKSLVLPNGDILTLVNTYNYSGGFFKGDFHLLRISPNGHKISQKTFDFGGYESANDLIATSDGGYMILCTTTVFNPQGPSTVSPPTLLKLDAQFNQTFLQSSALPITTDWTTSAGHIFEKANGYLVTGACNKVTASLASNAFSALYDAQGNLLSANLVDNNEETGYSAALLNIDGTFIISGTAYLPNTSHENSGWRLTKMNAAGTQILWQKTYTDSTGYYQGVGILKSPDGGYLMLGSRNSGFYMLKTDENGNQLWEKEGNNNLGWINAGAVLQDGSGYAVVFFDFNNAYNPRFILAKTNLVGDITFMNQGYGVDNSNNQAHHIVALSDGGFLITANRNLEPFSNLIINTSQVPYLVRTDAAGNTFYAKANGTIKIDLNGDCIAETDTLNTGLRLQAYKNGLNFAVAQTDSLGRWNMQIDTGEVVFIPQFINGAYTFCPDTLVKQVVLGDSLTNLDFVVYYNPEPVDSIFGSVFEDVDGDCFRDSFEIGRANWPIILHGWVNGQSLTPQTAVTDQNGHYVFIAPSGYTNETDASVSLAGDPADGLNCHPTCFGAQSIRFTAGSTVSQADFGVSCDSLPPCPRMEVDIATARIRPCIESNFVVNYCNKGALLAENTYITVAFDSLLTVNSSNFPYTLLADNILRFDIGSVGSEICGSFTISATLACNQELAGQTFCATAHIYPDSICAPPDPNLDGSQIVINGFCEQDSAIFILQNIGSGDMQQSLDYVVIEDNVLLREGNVQLPAGGTKRMAFAALGHFYRMQAGQSNNFINQNQPVAWVEACGGSSNNPISLGFVNQYGLGDQAPYLDVFCLQAVNSYDPNDKTGFPIGAQDAHYIEPNTELEYFIRFQNTGTAEAINIEIRDTLATDFLDICSVRPGAASFPYTFDLQGNNVVVFKFNGINLPDSTSNEVASHGFVKFRVKQQRDVYLLSQIHNQAAIFFDNNSPVMTNQTLHTVGHDFLILKSFSPDYQGLMLKMQPNPARDFTTLTLEGYENTDKKMTIRIFYSTGQPVLENTFTGNEVRLNTQKLKEGNLFFEVLEDDKRIGRGRFVKI
jgi:hypothetical protein